MKKLLMLAAFICAVAIGASPLTRPTFWSTGVDANGNQLVSGNELHWKINGQTPLVCNSGGWHWEIDMTGNWITGPGGCVISPNFPVGTYNFTLTIPLHNNFYTDFSVDVLATGADNDATVYLEND